MNAVRVVVVGCGTMGSSHARAYARLEGFTLAGLVDRSGDKAQQLARELGDVPVYRSLDESISAARPGAVAICTYPETHHPLTMKALAADESVRTGTIVYLP